MASSKSAEPPIFLIVAGPNGSGKSSIYKGTSIEASGRTVWIINPDLLTARIRDVEKMALEDANLAAVQRIEAWLDTSIEAHQSVGVETVLSTPKYRRLVEKAKKLGFETRLIYVALDSVERNIERVALRVKKGGHDVPREKIIKRYTGSLEQMPWFLAAADQATLYDNSGANPKVIADKKDGVIEVHDNVSPVIFDVIRRYFPSQRSR
jgi:predicted ABC-type ATPase